MMPWIYLSGGALGAVNGLLAAVLAWGWPGARRKGTLLAAALGTLFGCYEVWLYGALDRNFWGMLLLSGAMLSASATDLADHEISVRGMLLYAGALAVYQAAGGSLPVCINALLGAGAGVLILGLPYLLRPAAVGRGDVLLLAVCGLGAGFPGVIYVLARGLAAMALVSVVQLLRKKVTVRSEIPLAPFLLFGILI